MPGCRLSHTINDPETIAALRRMDEEYELTAALGRPGLT